MFNQVFDLLREEGESLENIFWTVFSDSILFKHRRNPAQLSTLDLYFAASARLTFGIFFYV
jgi:hypothetical protein